MSNKRIGFIVAGFTTDDLTSDTARKIEVLAVNQNEAIEAVLEEYPSFKPVGVINEDEIRANIASVEEIREEGKFGFIVGGHVGDHLLPETARTVAVCASDSTDAVMAAMDLIDDFRPVGTMSEYQMRMDLDLIETLKRQHEIE